MGNYTAPSVLFVLKLLAFLCEWPTRFLPWPAKKGGLQQLDILFGSANDLSERKMIVFKCCRAPLQSLDENRVQQIIGDYFCF
jgi:hypothetical protein